MLIDSSGADHLTAMYQPRWLPQEEQLELRGSRHRLLRWVPPQEDARKLPTPLPTVLLLHGFQDCADTFQFLVDALPRKWQFLALDWRGFGGSEWQHRPYCFADYLADLDQLLNQLAVDTPMRVVGHSMGGNIAGLYAGVRPGRIRWLVSLEGFGLRRCAADAAPQRYREWLDQLQLGVRASKHQSVETLAAALGRRNPRLPADIAAFVARAWLRPRPGNDHASLHFDPWHRLVNPVLYRREEAEACWRAVEAPVLIALGKESEYRQRLEMDGDIQRFIRCFRNGELIDFEGLGHMLHHESPVRVAQGLSDWMLRQDLKTAECS